MSYTYRGRTEDSGYNQMLVTEANLDPEQVLARMEVWKKSKLGKSTLHESMARGSFNSYKGTGDASSKLEALKNLNFALTKLGF